MSCGNGLVGGGVGVTNGTGDNVGAIHVDVLGGIIAIALVFGFDVSGYALCGVSGCALCGVSGYALFAVAFVPVWHRVSRAVGPGWQKSLGSV
jgi:hypothetical protein